MTYQESEQQKRLEAETLAYKQFMKVAKKVNYLQYGKWNIVPSTTDPLRKFTLEKDIGWCTIKLALKMAESYHRGNYGPDRRYYKPKLIIGGMFKDCVNDRELVGTLGMYLKPRMAKKLIQVVDEGIATRFYTEIEDEKKQRQNSIDKSKLFNDSIKLVSGLVVSNKLHSWDRTLKGTLQNCPFNLDVYDDGVRLENKFTFEELAKLSTQYGWGI